MAVRDEPALAPRPDAKYEFSFPRDRVKWHPMAVMFELSFRGSSSATMRFVPSASVAIVSSPSISIPPSMLSSGTGCTSSGTSTVAISGIGKLSVASGAGDSSITSSSSLSSKTAGGFSPVGRVRRLIIDEVKGNGAPTSDPFHYLNWELRGFWYCAGPSAQCCYQAVCWVRSVRDNFSFFPEVMGTLSHVFPSESNNFAKRAHHLVTGAHHGVPVCPLSSAAAASNTCVAG